MKTKAKPGLIGTRIAILHEAQLSWWRVGGRYVSDRTMEEMFVRWGLGVPRNAKKLWFHLYATPGVDRVKVHVERWFGPKVMDGRRYLFSSSRLDCVAKLDLVVGKDVYLEVEYLEP